MAFAAISSKESNNQKARAIKENSNVQPIRNKKKFSNISLHTIHSEQLKQFNMALSAACRDKQSHWQHLIVGFVRSGKTFLLESVIITANDFHETLAFYKSIQSKSLDVSVSEGKRGGSNLILKTMSLGFSSILNFHDFKLRRNLILFPRNCCCLACTVRIWYRPNERVFQ